MWSINVFLRLLKAVDFVLVVAFDVVNLVVVALLIVSGYITMFSWGQSMLI